MGRAGLGGIESGTPWCAEEDGTRDADIAHPELTLGKENADLWFIHDKAEVAVCRDAGGNETPWFRGPSPWGGPVSRPLSIGPPRCTCTAACQPERERRRSQPR